MMQTFSVTARRRPRAVRTTLAHLLAGVALLGATACTGPSTGPRNTNPLGIYGLLTVDRTAIPAEVFRGPYYVRELEITVTLVVKVTGGEVILQEDGSFHLAVDFTMGAEGREGSLTMTSDGTYEIDGGRILFETEGGSEVGSLRNGQITLPLDVMDDGRMKSYTFRHAP